MSKKKIANNRKAIKKIALSTTSASKQAIMQKSKILPLSDRVLIKLLDENEMNRKTETGIIIPDSVHQEHGAKKGRVVAVGEGKYEDGKLISTKVKAGDIVLFSWGDEIRVDGEEYQIVNESNILAILKI